MKHHFFILCLLTFFITTGCHQTKKTDSEHKSDTNVIDKEMSEIQEVFIPLSMGVDSKEDTSLITNLDLLGKIWGFLKYHHPEVGRGKYDWDNELFRFLPEYLKVIEPGQRDETLLQWIEKYGKIPASATTYTYLKSDFSWVKNSNRTYLKPDFLWLENSDMSVVLKDKIKEIYQNRHQGEHYYIKMAENIGNPEFLHEKPYSSFPYPDTSLRLLALYRYWNMIRYFFPSKYLTDKDWNEVLKEYIPKFILAKTALEYQLAVLQLTGEINDTHAGLVGSNKIDSLRGNMQVPFQVQFVENKLVVTDYFNPELKDATGLEAGDFITHVNGKKIEYIIDSIKSYYPASNEAVRRRILANDLVRSNNNTIRIEYNSNGKIKQKELTLYKRSSLNMNNNNKRDKKSSYDSILIDDSNIIGYITLQTIKANEIEDIKKSFRHAKGIIIDIRNYPSAFVPFSLGTYFVSKNTSFVKFTFGNINNPGEFNFKFGNMILKSEEPYQGKLVIIVNEITQSQAEFTAMAFRAGDNTVTIGSQTSGADGNVSYVRLPGGLQTRFSGLGIYYPDGQQTQRIGIVPDIEVKPTIQGIREGRDELLEKAIDIIQKEISR